MSRPRKPYAAAMRAMRSHQPDVMSHWIARSFIIALIQAAFHDGPPISVGVMPLPKDRILFTLCVGKRKKYAIFMGEHGAPIDKEYSGIITNSDAIAWLAKWLTCLVAYFTQRQAAGQLLHAVEAESVELWGALCASARQKLLFPGTQAPQSKCGEHEAALQERLERVLLRLCGVWSDNES